MRLSFLRSLRSSSRSSTSRRFASSWSCRTASKSVSPARFAASAASLFSPAVSKKPAGASRWNGTSRA